MRCSPASRTSSTTRSRWSSATPACCRSSAQDEATRQRAAEGPRRRRALRADRQDVPRHGARAPAAVRAGAAGRGGRWTRSSSPATACAPPTSRSCASLTADLPPVWGDSDQLHQVLTNLIVNAQQALLAGPAPRRLVVRGCGASGRQAVIEVEDNGPGMAPEVAQARLRALLHHQAAGCRHRRRPLGLPGHRHRARRPDRRATARPGQGTRFRSSCRCPQPMPRRRRRVAPVAGRPARGRVLVVDDEPEIAELVAEHLRRDGLTVEVVAQRPRRRCCGCESERLRRGGERPAHARPGRAGAGRRPCARRAPGAGATRRADHRRRAGRRARRGDPRRRAARASRSRSISPRCAARSGGSWAAA